VTPLFFNRSTRFCNLKHLHYLDEYLITDILQQKRAPGILIVKVGQDTLTKPAVTAPPSGTRIVFEWGWLGVDICDCAS
jgi:hypothetical protein